MIETKLKSVAESRISLKEGLSNEKVYFGECDLLVLPFKATNKQTNKQDIFWCLGSETEILFVSENQY